MHNHNAQDGSKHFALSCAGVDLDLGPRRIDLQNFSHLIACRRRYWRTPSTQCFDSRDLVGRWRHRERSGQYSVCRKAVLVRTTPLRALWQQAPYFHDGSAATLSDAVAHYNRVRTLGFTADQQGDMVEYPKSR
jgi:hypothetical protein